MTTAFFEANLQHWLSQYRKLGHTPSAASKDSAEKRAGEWQEKHRSAYRKKSPRLTPERIATLEATDGWTWQKEDFFEANRLNWLSQFQKLGRKPFRNSQDPDEKRAGQWQIVVRSAYRTSPYLTPERIATLEATEGWKWI